MKKVFKYILPVDDRKHKLPEDIVHAAPLGVDLLNVWCEVDEQKIVEANFQVFGTGQLIPDTAKYKSTVLSGPFVWHIYQMGDGLET